MLAPDARTVAFEALRAPSGYRLDFAVLTTYTLDLETLLALPLSLLACRDGGLEELLADPVELLQAIREAGDRMHVFVDEKGIGAPRRARELYATLESAVHAVRAPNGGAFHPKVWVARFAPVDDETAADERLRVAVLSRNLTYDRSWDICLASEATPQRRRTDESRPLADFLRRLPALATGPIAPDVVERVRELASQTGRCAFPAPDGFGAPIAFHALGLSRRRKAWPLPAAGRRMLAMAPFVNRGALDSLIEASVGDRTLVSRREALDRLPDDALAGWKTFVLADGAEDEPEDVPSDEATPPDDGNPGTGARTPVSDLHAKIVAVEHGSDVTWAVGSANLTAAAFEGKNVEMMAAIIGKKGRAGGKTGHGIDRFLEAGFGKLLAPYRRSDADPAGPDETAARQRLEAARDRLVEADMRLRCAADGDRWTLAITGAPALPNDDVEVAAWPISIAEDQARGLAEAPSWKLPVARLTTFIAFRLHVPQPGGDDIRLTRRLPAEGMPEDRIHHVLRSLVDSPEKFLRFLRALLGGLDAVTNWMQDDDGEPGLHRTRRGSGLAGETLLDDLLRTASRAPDRLHAAGRLIDDLRKTDEGRRIVPDDVLAIWTAVREALADEESRS